MTPPLFLHYLKFEVYCPLEFLHAFRTQVCSPKQQRAVLHGVKCDINSTITHVFFSNLLFLGGGFLSRVVSESHSLFGCDAMIHFHFERFHHNLPFPSLDDGYLGCFQLLAMKINAAICF